MQVERFPIFYDVVMGESNHFMAYASPFGVLGVLKKSIPIKHVRVIMAVLIIFNRRQTFSAYNDAVTLTIHPKYAFFVWKIQPKGYRTIQF